MCFHLKRKFREVFGEFHEDKFSVMEGRGKWGGGEEEEGRDRIGERNGNYE